MKRYIQMAAMIGIVLLMTGCGSSEPMPADDAALFAANGPALTVREEQPDQYISGDGDTEAPEQSPDLLIMNSQEEAGFALFYPLLNEAQFRRLMAQDGVDFIPDRIARCDDGGLVYYRSDAGDLVYCSQSFGTVKTILCEKRIGWIMDARWIDAERLMFLQGNESEQSVYLFRPSEQSVELMYQPPEGRQILGIDIDEQGQPVCILSALPQPADTVISPGSDTAAEGGASDTEQNGGGEFSAAKNNPSGGLWEDGDESSERGDTTDDEETTIPTEKVELEITAEP